MLNDPSVASLVDYLYEVAGEIEASPCLPSGEGVLLPTTRERLRTMPVKLREAASRLSEKRIHTSDKLLARVTPASPAATSAKCSDGHEWSNQFGDDWTPEDGTRCDCGKVGWGDAVRQGVMIRRVSAAERPVPTCAWKQEDEEDNTWVTECGNVYQFMAEGPTENRQKFCGYCGKSLKVVEPAAPRSVVDTEKDGR